MERSSTHFATTISKFNRGSLTDDEMSQLVDYLSNNLFKDSKKLFIINEHKNRLNQDFEHIHFFVETNDVKRGDNITNSIKKFNKFLIHKKDVLTKICYSDGWKEYISKSSDRKVLYQKGISDDDLKIWETDYKAKVETQKDNKKIIKTRINKHDLPYVIINYIISIDYNYHHSLSDFITIIKDMLKNNYDFEIKGKMVETRSKVDLILGNERMFNDMMLQEFTFIDSCSIDCLIVSEKKLISENEKINPFLV